MDPTQEDVARSLHQPLSHDHALAVVVELAAPGELLEHRGLSLLHLQEQRVRAVPTEHQRDPRACADAPHADDLAGDIDVAVFAQQHMPVLTQGGAIFFYQCAQHMDKFVVLKTRDQWGIRFDQDMPLHFLRELGEEFHMRASSSSLALFIDPPAKRTADCFE